METQSIEQVKTPELSEFQVKALKEAEENLEKLQKEFSKKKYLIDLNKQDIEMLANYISNDAPWKFTECLGIKEIDKELKECIKTGKLFISAIATEAMYYYLSKIEGKGTSTNAKAFTNIEDYLRILKSITSCVERIKADNEKIKNAEFVLAARREGIEPDSSVK